MCAVFATFELFIVLLQRCVKAVDVDLDAASTLRLCLDEALLRSANVMKRATIDDVCFSHEGPTHDRLLRVEECRISNAMS